MEGRIYIAGEFLNLGYSKCKSSSSDLDNDLHFWSQPPTWGICRTDFRKMLKKGDYVFFVLPKESNLPQMIFGYFKIVENISHITAHNKYPQKRMSNSNPNGNIIVSSNGNYNPYDYGIHKLDFNEIKKYYVVGDNTKSKFLSKNEIECKAQEFLNILQNIFDNKKECIFKIITQKGRCLNNSQINKLLSWLNG